MSKFVRFRRRHRLNGKPSLAERMQRWKQQPVTPQYWALAAGAVLFLGIVGWMLA